MKLRHKLLALISTLMLAGTAQASLLLDNPILDTPILGGNFLVATDGYLVATFLGSDAGYFNTLYLDSPDSSWDASKIFDKSTGYGASINLGEFQAGTELIFRLFVAQTGLIFYSGDGSSNPDGLAHATATTTLLDNGIYLTTVGFEDLLGGGDLDYNDFMFSLTNVVDPPIVDPTNGVPEPPVLVLLAFGLAGLLVLRRTLRLTQAGRG